MGSIRKDKLVEKIKEEFNGRFQNYKDELIVIVSNSGEIEMQLQGWKVKDNIGDFLDSCGSIVSIEEESLWLYITTLMYNLVESLEMNYCREGLDDLKEEIRERLYQVADKGNIDINTLWLSFECMMGDLKEELKRQYK